MLGATGAPLAVIAYFPMFSGVRSYDDEGGWAIALRSYHLHGSLYHHTYSQAGPFYYQLWSAFFSVSGLPVDLDTARAVTLGVWVLTATLIGWASYLLTLRATLGLVAVVVTFLLLFALQYEALEPAGLALLLVACLLLGAIAVTRGWPRQGMAVVGAAVAALILTKVNIGVFAAAAVVYSVVVCWPGARWQRTRQLAGAGILVGVPVALMAELLGRPWVPHLLVFELLGSAAIVITVAFGSGRRPVGPAPVDPAPVGPAPPHALGPVAAAWGVGGAAALTGAVMVVAVTNGTSPVQLVSGGLLSQRHLATIFSIPFVLSDHMEAWGIAGLLGSVGYAISRLQPRRPEVPAWIPGWGRIVAGAWVAVVATGGLRFLGGLMPVQATFASALPLTWLVIVPPSSDRRRGGSAGSPPSWIRVLVAALALLLSLQTYPVAGSQVSWSGFGLVMVAVLVISDGLCCLSPGTTLRLAGISWRRPRRGAALPLLLVAVLTLGNLVQLTSSWLNDYESQTPTGLSGATSVRWPDYEVGIERRVTALLQAECTTFVSLPGLNKFYFFTGEAPPTDLNTTQWMYLQDSATQQKVVDALRRIPRACAVENPGVLFFWQQGKPLPASSPLLRYIRTQFVPAQQVGDFTILVRPPPGPLP